MAASLDHDDAGVSFAEKLSVGHQEIDRIVDEVEQIYQSQPNEWLILEPIGSMVCHLWYEDEDEFEDAVGCSFEYFMRALPHVEVRANDDGKAEFKILAPDPLALPTIMTLHVNSRADLRRVLFKAPEASLRIPHMEFEVGSNNKRHIDTVYNHITTAVWNLSSHIRGRTDLDSEYVSRVSATCDELNSLLDVDAPFTFVVDDPTGSSIFRPDADIVVQQIGAEWDSLAELGDDED